MRELPRPGERYRHFKNKLYQIVGVARHSETGERMVVYQQLYGDYGVWVRPLNLFLSPVDKEKYPDADQEWRFEKVGEAPGTAGPDPSEKPGPGAAETAAGSEPEPGKKPGQTADMLPGTPESPALNPLLFDFLDAETIEKRLEVLNAMRGKVGQREIDSLYAALDLKPVSGSAAEELDHLRQVLLLQKKYDADRLRR